MSSTTLISFECTISGRVYSGLVGDTKVVQRKDGLLKEEQANFEDLMKNSAKTTDWLKKVQPYITFSTTRSKVFVVRLNDELNLLGVAGDSIASVNLMRRRVTPYSKPMLGYVAARESETKLEHVIDNAFMETVGRTEEARKGEALVVECGSKVKFRSFKVAEAGSSRITPNKLTSKGPIVVGWGSNIVNEYLAPNLANPLQDFDALKELLCETFLRIENEQSAALVGPKPNPTTVVSKDFEGYLVKHCNKGEKKTMHFIKNKVVENYPWPGSTEL
ncbi:hypothetical protein DdX_14394 [Ditylenchus destructor]|uniref:Uncharacterized protein n=1 Tax=Ditylenchus destructor TaxID=166010 RepID=A0AAD4MUD6_9BILA|nr:hypothetical protein DdX_14394 [Ditylenchus destructor]